MDLVSMLTMSCRNVWPEKLTPNTIGVLDDNKRDEAVGGRVPFGW